MPMSEMGFCMRCGAALREQRTPGDEDRRWVCGNPACGRVFYRNAKPCAGALVERDGAVLLVRRAIEPFRGAWDIPGGYLYAWEHPVEGARRELREETGLEIEVMRLLGIFIDRYGSNDSNTFNVYYRARPVGGTLQPADDAAEARWFRPGELPGDLAFPGHIPEVLRAWQAGFAAEPNPDPATDDTLAVHVAAGVRPE
jgi:ADP-ribose pyrophosphatase YjhB (NUDIX family)